MRWDTETMTAITCLLGYLGADGIFAELFRRIDEGSLHGPVPATVVYSPSMLHRKYSWTALSTIFRRFGDLDDESRDEQSWLDDCLHYS